MEPIPRTHQFVAVVNKKIDGPQLMNAVGHMAAGLVNQHRADTDPMRFRNFVDGSGSVHLSTSENGFIVLRSKNSNQLRELRNNLIEKTILFTDFTATMVPGDYVTQQAEFSKTPETELEYFGVCFFAEIEESRALTKKFSLYTGSATAETD